MWRSGDNCSGPAFRAVVARTQWLNVAFGPGLAEAAVDVVGGPGSDGLSNSCLVNHNGARLWHTLLLYTALMAMTTIRVETEVRDRLAARAAAHGRSLGAELRALLDEMMWQGIEAGYRRLAAQPDEMAGYLAEVTEWTSADLGELAATAAEEYPEYNS